ncbi:MAG: 50S ribosomal protein L15 [Patescibacteria group bacterium]|jgi:large subunit ribosomal protein L15
MSITLHTLQRPKGRQKRHRVGRGNSSGSGTYSGRGQKGQKARTGGRGGLKRRGVKQFLARIPKNRGFHSRAIRPETVDVADLEKHFKSGTRVSSDQLFEKKLITSPKVSVKILGNSKMSKKLQVVADAFSTSAEEGIRKVGGSAIRRR